MKKLQFSSLKKANDIESEVKLLADGVLAPDALKEIKGGMDGTLFLYL